MRWITKRRFIKRFTLTTLKIFLGLFALVFVIGPLIFKYSYKLQQSIVFSNFVDLPRNPNYSNPSLYGIEGVRNFYVRSDEDVKLGVWQILPADVRYNASTAADYFETVINNGRNVLIYYHGNSANRAAPHRIDLYKILRKHFHVITFDYRGYGDSTPASPTESTVVKDCMAIYMWVLNRTSSRIFVWGHSLGTGLSLHMLSMLSTRNVGPAGLILESPFTNIREEVTEHALAQPFKFLPWFHYTIVEPIQDNNFIFASDRHILNVNCPILILHAKDDRVVPYKLGYKLYQGTLKYRKPHQGSIQIIAFPASFGYGHKHIHRAPELPEIIVNFTSNAIVEMETKHKF